MPKHVDGAGLHTITCGALISHLRSHKSSKAIESIMNLSLTFNVLSPYTAFVLTEIKNTGTPSYATMIMEGLDLTVPEPGTHIYKKTLKSPLLSLSNPIFSIRNVIFLTL